MLQPQLRIRNNRNKTLFVQTIASEPPGVQDVPVFEADAERDPDSDPAGDRAGVEPLHALRHPDGGGQPVHVQPLNLGHLSIDHHSK